MITATGNNFGAGTITFRAYSTEDILVLNGKVEVDVSSQAFLNASQLEIYLPNHTDKEQNILRFKFPTNMTMEELVANSGMPEDEPYHYDGDNGYFADTYEYKKPAQKYLGSSSYRFEFTKGELSYITISYTP